VGAGPECLVGQRQRQTAGGALEVAAAEGTSGPAETDPAGSRRADSWCPLVFGDALDGTSISRDILMWRKPNIL